MYLLEHPRLLVKAHAGMDIESMHLEAMACS